MSSDADLIQRVARLEDEAAIRELCSRFCQGIDHREDELFMTIWAPDAEWVIGDDTHRGTEDVHVVWKASCDAVKWSRHLAANVIITWTEDSAKVRSELYGQAIMQDDSPNQVIVTILDDVVRFDGRLVLARRVVQGYEPKD